MLPDDVLVEIFDFCVVGYQDLGMPREFSEYDSYVTGEVDLEEREVNDYYTKRKIESWRFLVHVCRRWRGLVFGSRRRLNLQLYRITGKSARKSLDVWPALPLIIEGGVFETSVDDVIVELGHSDRICKMDLNCQPDSPDELWPAMQTTSQTEKLWTAMEVPFPELAVLRLLFGGGPYAPNLPDSFLGGSTPRLRYLALVAIPFPGLPKLLLSATHLVHLRLQEIPHSGYISPEVMANCLSMLTNLEELYFQFDSPRSSPDQESRRSPPPTRFFLPALTKFRFQGVKEYLELLVARIDTPRLCKLMATFLNEIDFATPELNQFISRMPTLEAYKGARLHIGTRVARVGLQSHAGMIEVKILCKDLLDRQLSSLTQICTSLRLIPTIENLYIDAHSFDRFIDSLVRTDVNDIETANWLDLLLPFTAAKNLYVHSAFWPRIASALQGLTGGRATEVLPALQNAFLETYRPSKDGIAQFVSARQLVNHPITVSVWDKRLSVYDSYWLSGSEDDD